jgi:hypothetical protein
MKDIPIRAIPKEKEKAVYRYFKPHFIAVPSGAQP